MGWVAACLKAVWRPAMSMHVATRTAAATTPRRAAVLALGPHERAWPATHAGAMAAPDADSTQGPAATCCLTHQPASRRWCELHLCKLPTAAHALAHAALQHAHRARGTSAVMRGCPCNHEQSCGVIVFVEGAPNPCTSVAQKAERRGCAPHTCRCVQRPAPHQGARRRRLRPCGHIVQGAIA